MTSGLSSGGAGLAEARGPGGCFSNKPPEGEGDVRQAGRWSRGPDYTLFKCTVVRRGMDFVVSTRKEHCY